MNPIHLKLDLISNCNQSCGFCPYHWIDTWSKKNINKNDKLGFDILESNVFDSSINFESLQISGSWESLLHPDFIQIVEFTRKKVKNLRLITNGTLINRYDEFISRNFDKVLVSIHGWKETHENIVNLKWSYKKAIDWIISLKKLWLRNTIINFVLTEKNIWDVKSLIDFSKEFNIEIVFSLDFIPDINKYSDLMPELLDVISYIKNNNYNINPNLNDDELKKFFTQKDYVIDPYKCEHINKAIEISANWDVYICRSNVFWNIYEKKMYEILDSLNRKNFLKQILEEQNSEIWLSDPRCNRCCYQKSPINNTLLQTKNNSY